MVDSSDTFRAELIALMRRRRLSGPKLAARARISDSAVYEWTSGRNLPSYLTAVGLARVLRWPECIAIVERDRVRRASSSPEAASAGRAVRA